MNSELPSKKHIYSPLWLYVHKVTACGFSCLIYYVKYCVCNTFSFFLFQLITVVTIKTTQKFYLNIPEDNLYINDCSKIYAVSPNIQTL